MFNVLFLCTGNSARSIIAESLLNHWGKGRFRAFSAGSRPKGDVHPLTLATLRRYHLPVDGLRSKSWDEFAQGQAMDFVFTVCDQAAGEMCPVWPGHRMNAHWGMPDPAAVQGSDDIRRQAFHDAAITLKRRLELLLALSMQQLDAIALKHEVRHIGSR